MTTPPPAIRIGPAGRFTDADGPFFPVGFYSVPHAETFAELRRAGFNTVHSYEFERTTYINPQCSKDVHREFKDFDGLGDEAARRYLDAAADHGLKVMMGFNRPGGVSGDVFSDTGRPQVEQRIKALRDHPGLWAWYVADEPDAQSFDPDAVLDCRRLVEALDPQHPTLSVLCRPDKFEQYAESGHVLMYDPYPVPVSPIDVVGKNLAKLKAVAGPGRPTVAVLQAFDWQAYDWRRVDSRAPTLQELRCMAYQAAVADVSGILFFCYHNEAQSVRACDNPRGWADLSSVARELRLLTPALLAPPVDALQCRGAVDATCRQVGEDVWVLAVNSQPQTCSASFVLPPDMAEAAVCNCFDAPARFTATGEFTLEFEPYGVRALRISAP